MTSQGGLYGQFQRALKKGNALNAVGLARELPRLSLADALALCLVLRDDEPTYIRFAVRWHSRAVSNSGSPHCTRAPRC